MGDRQLLSLQEQLFHQLGGKIDVYHSERDRIVYVLQHGAQVHPQNIIQVIQY